jgi:hypothetical protein
MGTRYLSLLSSAISGRKHSSAPATSFGFISAMLRSLRRKCLMSLPATLSDFTRPLRSAVGRAGTFSSSSLRNNTAIQIENMRVYLTPTPTIDEACAITIARCLEYADGLDNRGLDDAATREARDSASKAIDDLENSLHDARPSNRATILGLGWD